MDDDQVILSLLEAVKETNKDCSKGHARGYYKLYPDDTRYPFLKTTYLGVLKSIFEKLAAEKVLKVVQYPLSNEKALATARFLGQDYYDLNCYLYEKLENFDGYLKNLRNELQKNNIKKDIKDVENNLIIYETKFTKEEEQTDYDAFLSHADEDKESIADELFRRLKNDGFKIWYDISMKAGQSIPEEINEGIKHSKNGIVIFSKYYDKSQWCKEEFAALTYKSRSCKNFKIIIILHNFDLDIFIKEYPIHAHRLILLSKIGIDKIIGEIEPQLSIKTIVDKKEEIKDAEKYIKMSTNAVVEYYNFNPKKNYSMNNHSKKIILENLKDIPLTITKIVIKTDFPVIQNFFNSDVKIKLNEKEYKFDPTGEIEIWLNQNPLILSPKANISLILSLYTSTKVYYKNEYNFKYNIDINEFSGKSEGSFEIKTTMIEN